MADINRTSRPEFSLARWWSNSGGSFPMVVAAATFVVIVLVGISGDTSQEQKIGAVVATIIIGVFALIGYLAGAGVVSRIDGWFVDETFPSQSIRMKRLNFEGKKNSFLTGISAFVGLYLCFYLYAIRNFSLPKTPHWESFPYFTVSPIIILITASTLLLQLYFCVRYANYVKMITVLKAALDEMPAKLDNNSREILTQLNTAVFRDDQLYEPAGNIFVTMGIMATFLGLAVGLVTLDLGEITKRGGGDTSSLWSFVGCMGLALGMSMLGVLTAMAAQWLRGHGPVEDTGALLSRAADRLAPRGPRRTQKGVGTDEADRRSDGNGAGEEARP